MSLYYKNQLSFRNTFQINMSRIRIDLSHVLSQKLHPRIWLHLNGDFSTAQDIITALKKKYIELESVELSLSLEDFTIPPDVSINIFNNDDIVQVSSVEKTEIIKEPGINPQACGVTDAKKQLVSYPSSKTSSSSTTSSIILTQGNVSTTGLSAVDGEDCQPNHEPLKWSKEFSNFLKDGQEQCHSAKDFPPLMSLLISSSEVNPNIQSSDQVCKVATKTMSSVPSLNTEDITSNKLSSVKDSAKDCADSIENLSISTITDYTHTLGSDRVMVKKKRSDYLPWYNSSVSLSSIKEAKRTQCEAIKKRHEEMGSNWAVGNTYSQQHFETGHEDMMWVFSNSQVLNEIHTFMQVKRVYDFCLDT